MAGAVGARSRSSRASSTPPCEAASISTTSRCEPAAMRRHCSHFPHGSAVGPCSQLTILARILAVEVLLAADLVGGLRAVLPVERLVLLLVGHGLGLPGEGISHVQ